MAQVNTMKRGNYYQYRFEIAPQDGKRKFINKSGFKTKQEAYEAGMKAYNEYTNTGNVFKPSTVSFSDYLDYWMKMYCNINLRYATIITYENIIKNHIKPRLGFYRLSQITSATIQEFINNIYVEKGFSKSFLRTILKVLKGALGYATDVVGFIKINPALKVKIPKYDVPQADPAHIFTPEEIEIIFNRFRNSHTIYYAYLTYLKTKASELEKIKGISLESEKGYIKSVSVSKSMIDESRSTKENYCLRIPYSENYIYVPKGNIAWISFDKRGILYLVDDKEYILYDKYNEEKRRATGEEIEKISQEEKQKINDYYKNK